MAKLSFGKKKITGMVPPTGSGMGSMMGKMPMMAPPKLPPMKKTPVMKQKGMALSKFAPAMGKVSKKVAKKVPKKGAFPF